MHQLIVKLLILISATIGIQAMAQLPTVPKSLHTPSERASYLTIHFWDEFNMADTSAFAAGGAFEQHFADFISVFDHTDSTSIAVGFKDLLNKASDSNPTASRTINDLAETYLFELESPVHSDRYFTIYAIQAKNTELMRPVNERLNYLLRIASANAKGSIGNDFEYKLLSDSIVTLRNTVKAAPINILYIYDIDCDHCIEVMNRLKQSHTLQQAIKAGEAQIIAIYPEGDLTQWQSHALQNAQRGWIYGYAKQWTDDNDDEYYFIRENPTIYIINNQGRIIEKDASLTTIDSIITNTELENTPTN